MTNGKFPALNSTTQHKVVSVLVATTIFACLGAITTLATGRPLEIGLTNAILIGIVVGLFEEFYVQSQPGRRLRRLHPMRSISVYVVLILLIYFVTAHVTRLVLGRLDDLPMLYRRSPYVLTFFIMYSVVGVLMMMRVIHFIGLRTLFHLITGNLSPSGARAESYSVPRHQWIDRPGREARRSFDAVSRSQIFI